MNININAKKMVHHGVECAAFVAIGTWACSSFSAACATYGVGKITYLATRILLDTTATALSKETKRFISWTTSLLVGGTTLHAVQAEGTQQFASVLSTAAVVAGTTVASIGVRMLADKGVKYLTASST